MVPEGVSLSHGINEKDSFPTLNWPLSGRGKQIGSLALEFLQVVEIGAAIGAADVVEVEADVVFEAGVERAEEVAAELVARRATDALAPPDGPDRVFAAIDLFEDFLKLLAE